VRQIADVTAVALFVRCLQLARCEFLEARITPKRMEHGIEPEQRRVSGSFSSIAIVCRHRSDQDRGAVTRAIPKTVFIVSRRGVYGAEA